MATQSSFSYVKGRRVKISTYLPIHSWQPQLTTSWSLKPNGRFSRNMQIHIEDEEYIRENLGQILKLAVRSWTSVAITQGGTYNEKSHSNKEKCIYLVKLRVGFWWWPSKLEHKLHQLCRLWSPCYQKGVEEWHCYPFVMGRKGAEDKWHCSPFVTGRKRRWWHLRHWCQISFLQGNALLCCIRTNKASLCSTWPYHLLIHTWPTLLCSHHMTGMLPLLLRTRCAPRLCTSGDSSDGISHYYRSLY